MIQGKITLGTETRNIGTFIDQAKRENSRSSKKQEHRKLMRKNEVSTKVKDIDEERSIGKENIPNEDDTEEKWIDSKI